MVYLLKKMKGVDLDGRICKYDKWNCIDIDPYVIYEKGDFEFYIEQMIPVVED